MLRVLITGGAGFIGSNLVRKLITEYDITVADNLTTGRVENISDLQTEVQISYGSIQNPSFWRILSGQHKKYDIIIHLAAQALIGGRQSAITAIADLDTNVIGTIMTLKFAQEVSARRFVFASSGGTVYGVPDKFPVSEDAPLRPISTYGASKVAAEQYVRILCNEYHLSYAIMRLPNVFGPFDRPRNRRVVTSFIDNVLRNEPFVIDGNGKQAKDYVYVDDVVDAIKKLCEAEESGIWNVGSGTTTTVSSIARYVLNAFGKTVYDIQHTDPRPGDVREFSLDARRLHERFGWQPMHPMQDAIIETVNWYKDHDASFRS